MRWKKLYRCLACRSTNNNETRSKEQHSNNNAAKLADSMDQEVGSLSFRPSLDENNNNNNAAEDAMSLKYIIPDPKPSSSSSSSVVATALSEVELPSVTKNPIAKTESTCASKRPSTTTITSSQDDDASCNRQENETVSVAVVLRNETNMLAEALMKCYLSDREIRLGKNLRYKRRCSIVRTLLDNASLVLIPDLETSKQRKKGKKYNLTFSL